MLEPFHKAQQARSAICEQHVGALIEKRLSVGIEEQRIQEHIVRERRSVPVLFRDLKRHVPGAAQSNLLPQEKLPKHAKRAVPKRVTRKRSPLCRIACNLLEPLKPRPVGRQIMLKLNPAASLVPAQRASDREIVKNGCVSTLQLTHREAVLERRFALGKPKQKPLYTWLVVGPVPPKPIGNRDERQHTGGVLPLESRSGLNNPRQGPQIGQRRHRVGMSCQPSQPGNRVQNIFDRGIRQLFHFEVFRRLRTSQLLKGAANPRFRLANNQHTPSGRIAHSVSLLQLPDQGFGFQLAAVAEPFGRVDNKEILAARRRNKYI